MRRMIIISFCVAMGVTMLVMVFLQQNRITTLKAERAQILVGLPDPAKLPPTAVPAGPPNLEPISHSPAIELLQLRAEVTRLGIRKRELASAPAESDRLQVQLVTRATNAPSTLALPAGYIKKSEAKFVGYNTPEETVQSSLWAIQSHDAAGFLKALDGELAKQFEAKMQSHESIEEFFKEADSLPGMNIVGKEAGADGEVVLAVEIMPGDAPQPRIRFKQNGGQWKMVSGF